MIAASLVVSIVFLWLALRDVPLAEVAASISEADPLWVILSFLSIIVALWVRAIRWRGLLGYRIDFKQSLYIIAVTFLLNQLPLRAGEVARSLLATRSGVPVVTAATSIIVERLLDTLSYEAPDKTGKVTIDRAYVDDNLGELVEDPDLSRYIL